MLSQLNMLTVVMAALLCFVGYPSLPMDVSPNSESVFRNMMTTPTPFPMRFTENRGQVVDTDGNPRPDILFIARAGAAQLYFTSAGMSTVFLHPETPARGVSEATGHAMESMNQRQETLAWGVSRVTMTLAGSNSDAVVTPRYELAGASNCYLGQCPQGVLSLKSYRQLSYRNVYEGVDLVYHAAGSNAIKYEFVIAPGVDPSSIRMRYDGAEALYVDGHGALHIMTAFGEEVQQAPYGICDDGTAVACAFKIQNDVVSFAVDTYDKRQALVIDPWATYFGGEADDACGGVAIDANGNVYVSGVTSSTVFPISNGAFQSSNAGGWDFFISKLDVNGAMIWSTLYGSSTDDWGVKITLDPNGNVIASGYTSGTTFPVSTGSFQSQNAGGTDVVIIKFDNGGARLWATYFGGQGTDSENHVATDANGNILVTGGTNSANFPVTSGSYDIGYNGSNDGFIAEFTSAGSLVWSTYYGGSSTERPRGIRTDGSGNVIIVGRTSSSDLPVTSGSLIGGSDMFVAKFAPTGTILIWATYYGGDNQDIPYSLWIDGNNNIAVSGYTDSPNFPVSPGAFQSTKNSARDAYLVKFDGNGNRLWATFCGGSGDEWEAFTTGDANGNVFLAGTTSSTNFPVTPGAFQTSSGGNNDAYIVKFGPTGNRLWGTYYGGGCPEFQGAATTDSYGNVVIVGKTGSTNLPTYYAQRNTLWGFQDAYIAIFDPSGVLPVELSSFTASWTGRSVLLRWITESETNNRGFTVERSMTAREGEWEICGFVQGSGTSRVAHDYTFLDDPPTNGYHERMVFYRLEQVDFDGSTRHSAVVAAFPRYVPAALDISPPYPQPADRAVTIEFSLEHDDVLAILLCDVVGRNIVELSTPRSYAAGRHIIALTWEGIPTGVYYLQLHGTSRSAVRKLAVR